MISLLLSASFYPYFSQPSGFSTSWLMLYNTKLGCQLQTLFWRTPRISAQIYQTGLVGTLPRRRKFEPVWLSLSQRGWGNHAELNAFLPPSRTGDSPYEFLFRWEKYWDQICGVSCLSIFFLCISTMVSVVYCFLCCLQPSYPGSVFCCFSYVHHFLFLVLFSHIPTNSWHGSVSIKKPWKCTVETLILSLIDAHFILQMYLLLFYFLKKFCSDRPLSQAGQVSPLSPQPWF